MAILKSIKLKHAKVKHHQFLRCFRVPTPVTSKILHILIVVLMIERLFYFDLIFERFGQTVS